MSCGSPHDTSCAEVLDAVSAYLDGELDPAVLGQLQRHFEECAPCLKEAGVYQEVKVLVQRCCGNDQMPTEVRARVVARIRAVSVTWTELTD